MNAKITMNEIDYRDLNLTPRNAALEMHAAGLPGALEVSDAAGFWLAPQTEDETGAICPPYLYAFLPVDDHPEKLISVSHRFDALERGAAAPAQDEIERIRPVLLRALRCKLGRWLLYGAIDGAITYSLQMHDTDTRGDFTRWVLYGKATARTRQERRDWTEGAQRGILLADLEIITEGTRPTIAQEEEVKLNIARNLAACAAWCKEWARRDRAWRKHEQDVEEYERRRAAGIVVHPETVFGIIRA